MSLDVMYSSLDIFKTADSYNESLISSNLVTALRDVHFRSIEAKRWDLCKENPGFP